MKQNKNNNQKFTKKSIYLQKSALNRSLNTEEKIELNIKTFNPKNKVYFRNFTSLDSNPLGIQKISNWNDNTNKESIGNTIPENNCFSLSLKNSFSRTTKNSCEKMNLFNQHTIRENSFQKYILNNMPKKRKTFGREIKNVSNHDIQKTNQRKSNNNIFQKNAKNNSYDTKNIISTRSANNFYPEKPNEISIDFINDSIVSKKKKKYDKYINTKSNEKEINFESYKKNSFNYKNINNDSLIKQKLINKMKINKNNSNIINNKGNKEISYLNISNISNDNKQSNIQLYDKNKNKLKTQGNNNSHYYNMSLKKYKYNNNLITNSNNNIFDDSNIKKIKVNINNNLNKSKNKNNRKKNSLNKTISNTNNINENKNNSIHMTNNYNINNRYNFKVGSQLQNYNSKRDIFHEEYKNLLKITPRITKCNTPTHNKIYNTKESLQKSIDCNTIYQLENQNNDIDLNMNTEKNKNIYQILYNNDIGKNLLNNNRNHEWSNLYYSIDSNNLRQSDKKIDLTFNKTYKNDSRTKINDLFAKEKIKNIDNKNEASINDYLFVKNKNCIDIDYIYKNKYGIKVFKSNDNIYPSHSNTRTNSNNNNESINFENVDENRENYNNNGFIKMPKLFLTKTENRMIKGNNNNINYHITTEPNSIDEDTNENNNNLYNNADDEYYSMLSKNNDNSIGIKLYLSKNEMNDKKNINNYYYNQKNISNQNRNPKISLNINNNNNKNHEINVNRNNNIMKTNTENCFNIFLNNDNISKKFTKKNKSINITFDEKEKNSNMNNTNDKDANKYKNNMINLQNEEYKLKNINKYKAKIYNNQINHGITPSYLKSSSIKYNPENISDAINKKKKFTKSFKNINFKNSKANNNIIAKDNNINMNKKKKLIFNNSEAYLFNGHNFNNLNEKYITETINNNNKNISIYINKSVIDSFKIQPQYNPNLNMINYYNQINIGKPLLSTGNPINLNIKNRTQNQTPKNIYKKPNCTKPKSKPKINDKQKFKTNNNKIKNNITTLKRHKGVSKSLNLEFNFNIFPPFYLKDKNIRNYSDKLDHLDSNKKMSCCSLNVTPKNNINSINLYDNELLNEKKANTNYSNLIIDNVRKSYEKNNQSFISKKYNYFIKKTLIETCYIDKCYFSHSLEKSMKDFYLNTNNKIILKNKKSNSNSNETFSNNKNIKYYPKNKNQPLLIKISDTNTFKNIKFNKDIKLDLNDFRNNNKTKNNLNSLKSKNSNKIGNEDTSNPIKIFNKQNKHTNNHNSEKVLDSSRLNKISYKHIKTTDFINSAQKENIYDTINDEKKIYLNTFSSKGNKFLSKNILSNGIYIKPNYNKSRSNSKGSKIHSGIDIVKEERRISLNKLKSNSINTSFDNMSVFRNKFSHTLNPKAWHSTNSLFHTSFEIKSKKNKDGTNKRRVCRMDKNCYISKYYNYSLKVPPIDMCFFVKNEIKNFNKKKKINIDKKKKNEIYNSIRRSSKTAENLNKNKLLNNTNNKITLSNIKVNNEDDKLSESSQNGLFIMNNDANNLRKKNTDFLKANEFLSHYNNYIVNDESDLEIYKKLDILKNESKNNLEIIPQNENDELKFNFSDESELRDERNSMNSLYYLNEIQKTQNEKEVDNKDENTSKINKKISIDNNCNLKKAEKGLKILREITVRREYKNENENEIKVDKNKINISNKYNKKNERMQKCLKKVQKIDLIKKNSNESSNVYNSVNKDILKGISKIERLFNKKCSSSNMDNYSGIKNENSSDKNSNLNTNNISDYNDEIKQKMRTYLHKIESNVNSPNYKILDNNEDNSNILGEKNNNKENNKKDEKNEINKKYNLDFILSYKNNIYSSKDNLLNKEIINHFKDLLSYNKDYTNDNKNLISNIYNTKYYLEMSKEHQSKNIIKYKIINLLNILTKKSYNDIFNKIADIILYQNNDKVNTSTRRLNSIKDIINNQQIFKYEIVQRGISENIYSSIYAKLCNDLDNKITTSLAQKDIKINKEKKLKYIISEECINLLNKYKDVSKNNFNKIKKESDEYYTLKKNIIGYSSFIYELINKNLLKQQFGYNLIEQFFKIYNNKDINDLVRFLYLEACINLIYNLGKEVKNNEKYIQTLKNYINNNLSNIINNNENIPNHLKYRIIKLINKNKKSWNNSFSFKDNDSEKKEVSSIKRNIKNNENEKIIEEDLINYITYSTELDSNGQIIIKNNFDKSYNWKYIDELINEKNYGLQYFINNFIKICSYTIKNENQLIISNDYIKNIIEYYANNLSNQDLDLVQREMIKTFFNIDDFVNNNVYMVKILGNLLFVLIENKLYHIKYFNKYLKVENKTQINLTIITKYCIISSGKFAKRYFNDFKQTKLFINSNIFEKYVNEALKDLFYFIK